MKDSDYEKDKQKNICRASTYFKVRTTHKPDWNRLAIRFLTE